MGLRWTAEGVDMTSRNHGEPVIVIKEHVLTVLKEHAQHPPTVIERGYISCHPRPKQTISHLPQSARTFLPTKHHAQHLQSYPSSQFTKSLIHTTQTSNLASHNFKHVNTSLSRNISDFPPSSHFRTSMTRSWSSTPPFAPLSWPPFL
jgi:hypothetical protein